MRKLIVILPLYLYSWNILLLVLPFRETFSKNEWFELSFACTVAYGNLIFCENSDVFRDSLIQIQLVFSLSLIIFNLWRDLASSNLMKLVVEVEVILPDGLDWS